MAIILTLIEQRIIPVIILIQAGGVLLHLAYITIEVTPTPHPPQP